jgi:hypothetical protein
MAMITKYAGLKYQLVSRWVCDGVGGSGCLMLLAPF